MIIGFVCDGVQQQEQVGGALTWGQVRRCQHNFVHAQKERPVWSRQKETQREQHEETRVQIMNHESARLRDLDFFRLCLIESMAILSPKLSFLRYFCPFRGETEFGEATLPL